VKPRAAAVVRNAGQDRATEVARCTTAGDAGLWARPSGCSPSGSSPPRPRRPWPAPRGRASPAGSWARAPRGSDRPARVRPSSSTASRAAA
jgi:hypothetical protein